MDVLLQKKEVQILLSAFPNSEETIKFVGGCVRDSLMNLPIHDYDLATSYTPDEIVSYAESKGLVAIRTGNPHDTIMVLVNGFPFEITSLCADEDPLDCEEKFSTIEVGTKDWVADAKRRDLTINAIYMNEKGEIFDPCGGLPDLKNGVVQFNGDPRQRIKVDLRMWRYFRFYALFAKQRPSENTLKAIKEYKCELKEISNILIRQEFLKMLKIGPLLKAVELMHETGVIQLILQHNNVSEKFKSLIRLEDELKLVSHHLARFYALIDGDFKKLPKLMKLYKFSLKDTKFLKALHRNISEEHDVRLRLHFQGKDITLAWFMLTSNDKSLLKYIQEWEPKTFYLTGKDLIEEGIKPGKELGKELRRREEEWILEFPL